MLNLDQLFIETRGIKGELKIKSILVSRNKISVAIRKV